MKSSVSSFDIVALIPELREELIGAYLQKLYQPERDEILFVFRAKNGKREMLLKSGKYLFMGRKGENPQEPGSLVMFLRKNIGNARVKDIIQHGFDRIVEIDLEREERYTIIAEFFRNGNISVVRDGIILVPLFFQRWSSRALIPKEEYRYPPESTDPRSMGIKEISERILGSKKDLVRTLATQLNLGGTYAEEICLRAGLDKKMKASDLSGGQIKTIEKALREIFSELENPRPAIYYKNSEPVDFSPISLRVYEGYEKKDFASMNEAIYSYFTSIPEIREKKDGRLERIERQIAQQERSIEEFREEMERAKRKADIIYAHYNEIERLLGEVRGMKGKEFAALRQLPYFVSLDLRKKRITVKIDGENITLDFRGVNESAQYYYERVKKLRDKIKGAEEALERSKKMMESASTEAERREEKKKRRLQWFERYRWFISSDENLVIAGRDAGTNERVVKKHMKDNDIYAHAEIHGAPSVIIKRNGEEPIGEQSLKEACEFALCFSKAWPSKIAGGAAYWVRPHQVSKTPQSGEFLARGAFVVRGKRNYLEAELKLAVGFVNYRNERLLTCALLSAMHKWCDEYYIIVPGDERKETVAKKLSKEMGADVDDLVRVLPPGGTMILEKRKGEGERVERRF